jgi:hypothetical protein
MLLAAALATVVLAQANPPVPSAGTGAVESVTTNSAVVDGTVNPNGAAATYHVEYGTGATYGLSTPDQDAGSGTDPVAVKVTLSKLTQNTTYHYRVVATNAAGTVGGTDHTLHTARAPSTPIASTRPATQKGPLSGVVNGLITPRGLPTTVHFLYGLTTAYGAQTPDVALGAGFSGVPTSASLTGLQPHTRYHFRAVASNSLGSKRGGDRYFTTASAPSGVIVTPSITRVRWGTGLQIVGAVTGQGSIDVALERQDAPYDGPFAQVATTRAASNGAFTFFVPPLEQTARLRVTTLTPPVIVSSAARTISVALRVGIKTSRLSHNRVRLSGAIWPEVPAGRVSLQRRSRSRHWHTLRHANARHLSGGRSQYRFTVKRTRSRQSFRAVVVAHDGGRHVPGESRAVRTARRR